jgi:hypothetical protein
MNHIAAARAAALAVVFAGAAGESYVYADEPCTRAHVATDEDNHKVVVSFDNRCTQRISCDVAWSLRCGHGDVVAKAESVSMGDHSAAEVTASAASCGDEAWRISPPRWRCDQPGDPVITGEDKKPRARKNRR